jgi:peptidoglycan/LPS O-acetylase OafA/YrhL
MISSVGPASRIDRLDGLRGLSVILVVAGHVGAYRLGVGQTAGFLAEFGVQCFFVLSGYLITSLLDREYARTQTVDLRAFYTRRVLRLAPAMLAFLGVIALLKAAGQVVDVAWYTFGLGLTYLLNIGGRGITTGHLWSLSLEEQFYLVWPVLFLAFPKRRRQLAVAIILAVASFRTIGIITRLYPYELGIFYERPWFRFDSLMVGCLFALLNPEGDSMPRTIRRATKGVFLPLMLGVACLLAVSGDRPSIHPIFLTVQLGVACWFVLHVLLHPGSLVPRLLAGRFWVWLGGLSYSIYLWQEPFCVTILPDWGWLRRFPLCLIPTMACALASHHWIEKPFLRLKRRFERARVVDETRQPALPQVRPEAASRNTST